MKIAKKYSHLNGEEYLIVHYNNLYKDIKDIVKSINANNFKTKKSKEKNKIGLDLYIPIEINKAFDMAFSKRGWEESRYSYYITLNRELMEKSLLMSAKDQKEYLIKNGENNPIFSYNQTDFVKDKIAVEVQFGKYSFVAYDLFVKHMMFFTGGVIDVGIEILPMKEMQKEMSSGIAYFEGEVYNLLRQGRGSPPVPLLIIGVAP